MILNLNHFFWQVILLQPEISIQMLRIHVSAELVTQMKAQRTKKWNIWTLEIVLTHGPSFSSALTLLTELVNKLCQHMSVHNGALPQSGSQPLVGQVLI